MLAWSDKKDETAIDNKSKEEKSQFSRDFLFYNFYFNRCKKDTDPDQPRITQEFQEHARICECMQNLSGNKEDVAIKNYKDGGSLNLWVTPKSVGQLQIPLNPR